MKSKIITTLGLLGLTSTLFASNGAQNLFDNKCSMCHIKTMPQNRSKLVAPPVMGLMYHLKMKYPNKQDAVAFIVDYVQNPTRAKALCKPQKIQHFGLMPSQKGNITPQELQKVASWMFDTYPPSNFRGGMHRGMQQGSMMKQGMMRCGMKNHKRPTFEMIDANGDGVVTKAEFTAFQKKRMAMMKKRRMQCKNTNGSGMMNQGMKK